MTILLRYWPHLLATLLVFSAGVWVGYQPGRAKAQAAKVASLQADKQFLTDALMLAAETLDAERQKARELAAVAQQYEQDKADALDREARLRADLGAGNRKLRHDIGALYTSQLSGAAAHSAELAAAAQRGAEALAAAIGVGAECDARDKALRALAEADRK